MMIPIISCVCYYFAINLIAAESLSNCPTSSLKFEKVLGLRPSSESHPLLLYQNDSTTPITSACIEQCQSKDDCRSFVLHYKISTCYWYKSSADDEQQLHTVIDTDVAWFVKVCLEVSCDKLWVFERIPGAILIGNDTKILPNLVSRSDCQQQCLNETEFICKSAKFKIQKSNFGPNASTTGQCILSNSDRHLLPNSYRVSSFDEEYFENQCHSSDYNSSRNAFCAYEEFDNVVLGHGDELYANETKEECLAKCDEAMQFNCRGYSIIHSDTNTMCLLHAEDSKVHGPKLLLANPQATYYEKARCLNISVSCSDTFMNIKYIPELNFMGRIYLQGYSEHPECFTIGKGRVDVNLKIPLLSNQCGVIKANGVNNRTLYSGIMVLQYNSLIQTQSDRLIRVGCIFGNDSKILLGTGVTISPSPSNKGSSLVNTSANQTGGATPKVQMRIIDLNTQEEVSDTQIGQELQLIIEIDSANDTMDIWAGHLVAMTEKNEESIFLLDDRGCPSNLNVFPALAKVVNGSDIKLVATFQAFKFASSPVVRFSVIVQFCPKECQPVDCGYNVQSYGRRKREVASHLIHTINGSTVVKINRSEFETRTALVYEKPLEYIMVVRDPKSKSDRLVFGDSKKILFAGYDYTHNEVCLDYSLVVGLILTWVIIQIVFVICCVLLVRRYKRYYAHECTRQSLEELHKNFGIGFSNLDNRRVRWADTEDIS